MFRKMTLFCGIVTLILACASTGLAGSVPEGKLKTARSVVTADTILSGMAAALLPPERYFVEAILPPGQCPGHYDVKLSDVEKMKKADLIISFRGMGFMNKSGDGGAPQLFVEAGDRNWMAPLSYIYGLSIIAAELGNRFPEDKETITGRKRIAISAVKKKSGLLAGKLREAGTYGYPVIASSLQKETLSWMGFRVIGEYGRPEAMSARELVRLTKIGREQKVIMVVDNLQSGPDAGKGIAEVLDVPHVVLTNFPSEKGYEATLEENVNSVLAAAKKKR